MREAETAPAAEVRVAAAKALLDAAVKLSGDSKRSAAAVAQINNTITARYMRPGDPPEEVPPGTTLVCIGGEP